MSEAIIDVLLWVNALNGTATGNGTYPGSGATAASLRKARTEKASTPIFLIIYSIGLLVTLGVLMPVVYKRKWNRLPVFILCIIFNILCIASSAVRIARVFQTFNFRDPKQAKKFLALQNAFVYIRTISYILPIALVLSVCIIFIKVLVGIGLVGRKVSYLLYGIASTVILATVITDLVFLFLIIFKPTFSSDSSYVFFSLMSSYIFCAGLFFIILALRIGIYTLYMACAKKALKRVVILFCCVFLLMVFRIPAYFVAMTGVLTRGHINFIISHLSECMISFVVCAVFHEKITKRKKSNMDDNNVVQVANSSHKAQESECGEVIEMTDNKELSHQKEEKAKEQSTTPVETIDKPLDEVTCSDIQQDVVCYEAVHPEEVSSSIVDEPPAPPELAGSPPALEVVIQQE